VLIQFWYRIGRTIVSLIARSILELSVEWKNTLPSGPFILAANHPSTIDPAIVTTLTPQPVTILIRNALFRVPLFGRSLKACGHLPVIAGQGQQVLDEAERLIKAGKSVVIFPEGEISPLEGGFRSPRTGLARLALATGVPVIPLGIGLDVKQLRFTHSNIDDIEEVGTWYFHGPYAVTIGKAMTFLGDASDRERVHQISEQVMTQISRLAGESNQRIRTRQRMTWLNTARWWLWSPVRLIRSWDALQGVRLP
jgi:1-acyl-sn-glycerol-3-phosphate acyltransferase